MHDRHLYIRECQPLMQWEEVSFGEGLVTYCSCSSLHKRGHLSWSDTPPPNCPLPIYPWSFSFPWKHLPSLVPGLSGFKFTAPIFLSLYHFCQCMPPLIDWACASHRAVLNLSQMVATYSSTCLVEASLMGALLLPMVGKKKSTGSLGLRLNIK